VFKKKPSKTLAEEELTPFYPKMNDIRVGFSSDLQKGRLTDFNNIKHTDDAMKHVRKGWLKWLKSICVLPYLSEDY